MSRLKINIRHLYLLIGVYDYNTEMEIRKKSEIGYRK